jgi:hypothetical protein
MGPRLRPTLCGKALIPILLIAAVSLLAASPPASARSGPADVQISPSVPTQPSVSSDGSAPKAARLLLIAQSQQNPPPGQKEGKSTPPGDQQSSPTVMQYPAACMRDCTGECPVANHYEHHDCFRICADLCREPIFTDELARELARRMKQ